MTCRGDRLRGILIKNNNSLEKECFVNCPHYTSTTTREQTQKTTLGYRTFRCSACKHLFNERTGTPFNFLEYPTDVVLLVVLWRLRYKWSLELRIAADAHPSLVTIWLGLNDIVANVPVNSYAQDLLTRLRSLRTAAPHVLVAIGNIPELTLLPHFSTSDPQQMSQVVQAYTMAFARRHAILVDLTLQNYNLNGHPEYMSDEGLHPNDIGYQQRAKLFETAIQATQKQVPIP
jgi:hypothetical protein